ncbi:hypothetical protein QVO10_01655 [Bacteroides gallinaceum]|uniref:YubB ferredoxin-like domain-containing protein n=1 Tax=Bacteroides gallinaceum TaxID=1462571 RepID=A0ABT7X1Y8_9BACE|nr:hypothetical protein [Bacteroides gallinaceum]MBM6943746.1 hypothetical protein [Bacteroides gallinaceum]MDN0048102.1 hypothetical protein [Bacteroides gallinaceum]
MPNWCSTAYVVEGDAKEIKSLYGLMKRLQDRKKPAVKNDFGTTWLGCLVNALGKDWKAVSCRGSWSGLKLDGDVLKFNTETAWAPCNETFEAVREKYPSLRYYFIAEEPGLEVYETNDECGVYFKDRYYLDACTPDGDYLSEYFEKLEDVFKWIEVELGKTVMTEEDIADIDIQWSTECEDAFCYLHEFEIVD